jgi:periplasmic protein TonB
MDRTPGPNWLLRALIFISVGVHAIVYLHLSGVYRNRTLTYLEMSLQNIRPPAVRDIPRPRPRPKAPDPEDQTRRINVVQRPMPRFKPLAMAPLEENLPDTLVEGIDAPDVPRAPGVDSADWVPGPQAREATAEFMTPTSYLDMVKLKIESRKRYPEAAKDRHIEGRVKVHFILATDGSVRDVTVLKAARHSELNLAALNAVRAAAPFPRPPAHLFKGNLSLDLIIVFELT